MRVQRLLIQRRSHHLTPFFSVTLLIFPTDIYSTDYDDLAAEVAQRKRNHSDVIHSVSALSYNKGGGAEDEDDDQAEAGARNGGSKYLWEYMGQDGQVHGPFTTQQILDWRSQGFFSGDSAVHMRLVQGTEQLDGEQDREEEEDGRTDRGGGAHSPRKRVRFNEPPKDTTQDLLNDLDDDDENGGDTTAHGGSLSAPPTLSERRAHLQWQSSDAIAFQRFR